MNVALTDSCCVVMFSHSLNGDLKNQIPEIYLNLVMEGLSILHSKIEQGDMDYDFYRKLMLFIFRVTGRDSIQIQQSTINYFNDILAAFSIISMSEDKAISVLNSDKYNYLQQLEKFFCYGKQHLMNFSF